MVILTSPNSCGQSAKARLVVIRERRVLGVELADEMEQQLACAGLAEGKIPEFIDDDEIVAQEFLRQPSAFARGLLRAFRAD